MNIEGLREVARIILEHPKNFCMRSAFTGKGTEFSFAGGDPRSMECDTAACIAGWGAALQRHELMGAGEQLNTDEEAQSFLRSTPLCNAYWGVVRATATEFFDIGYSDGTRLYFVDHWPVELEMLWYAAKGDLQKQAQIAYDRITMFIESEGLK